MINPTFRATLILFAAVLLSACGRSTDSTHSILSITFNEKPVASLNLSLRCSYDWAYFSEQDMASHYNVKPMPARAPNVFINLPDTRVLFLTPQPWPPLDKAGRCNLWELNGWRALVFDPRKAVPLLTIVSQYEEYAGAAGGLAGIAIRHSSGSDGNVSSPSPTAPMAFQQAIEKASSLDFAILEVPLNGDTVTKIPAESVSALLALPSDRPSVLLPAKRSDTPLDPDDAGSDGTLAGLPNFYPIKFMDEKASSDYPSAPGRPISVDPFGPGLHDKVYFPSDILTPSVMLPSLEKPVMIAPAAAVWYPLTRRLVVLTWTKRSRELTKLIN